MTNKITNPNLYNDNIEYVDDSTDMPISNEWQRTLSNLVGWDYVNEKARLIGVDEDGNVKIDLSSVPATGFSVGITSVETTGTIISNSNTERRSITIYNSGSETVYVGDNSSIGVSTGFPIPPMSTLKLDNYQGAVYGSTSTSSVIVRRLELED